MKKRNITLSISRELIQKAKIIAVKNNTSLSRLLQDYLTEIVERDEAYGQAREKHEKALQKGFNLGLNGKIRWTREELHDR